MGRSRLLKCHHGPWLAHMVRRRWVWKTIIELGQHTQGRATSGVACHNRPCKANTVRIGRACHVIIALGLHTQSNDVGRRNAIIALDDIRGVMRAWSMGSTHCQTMSRVACQYQSWLAHIIRLRRAWHAIMALGQHTRSDDVRCERPLSHLDSIHTVGQRLAWHDIISLGQHTRSEDVGRGMLSSPMDFTHDRTTLGMAMLSSPLHAQLDDVRRKMPSLPLYSTYGHDMPAWHLGSTHGRMKLGVACHYRPCAAHTFGQRRALHAIISLGQHIWSDYVGRDMPPLECTQNTTTSSVTCHHFPLKAYMIRRCWAWHEIIAFRQHTQSNNVGHGILAWPFGSTTRSDYVGRDMPSSPLEHTRSDNIEHIMQFFLLGLHTQWDDIGRGMPSLPLDNIHSRTKSGVAFHHGP
ncbi:hypothetical protein EJD97_024656 [Solanum chilense]|uniref:Uncharacterized protein n=1 Tax=Solanum chilense TaxID=4083 RepID=A0A6N2AQQ7_SOLCI|nr:hypothetical protein EJD97_024656 [Solanum chilense]